MKIEFEVSTRLPAGPDVIYAAWLDSEHHSAMTGAKANVSGEVGQSFDAWDGYIQGVNLELEPGRRIKQSWRTTEFNPNDDDSLLEIVFEPENTGTLLTLRHWNLPQDGMQYKQGWEDSYFRPMQRYFSEDRS